MGGKGKRRREKNYRAAHGGSTRLPPPPTASSLDAVPSKLRKIMSFTASTGAAKASSESSEKKKRNSSSLVDKARNLKNVASKVTSLRSEGGEANLVGKNGSESQLTAGSEKKRKRKHNIVNDLRFEATDEIGGCGSKRKERKKLRLEERKKKRKKGRAGEDVDFPGHEPIKFGEVVEAPPKLVVVPRPLKNTQVASVERLRLQAVENYRKRKGWSSRPGIQLPPPVTSSPVV